MISILQVDLAEYFTALHFMQDIIYVGNRVSLSGHCFVGTTHVDTETNAPLGFDTSTAVSTHGVGLITSFMMSASKLPGLAPDLGSQAVWRTPEGFSLI